MDVLSEVLKVVELQGAVYYNGEFSAPWRIRAASSHGVAQYFVPGKDHVIIFHLMTEGRCTVRTEDGERVALVAGDIVMVPHNDTHIMENGSATVTFDDSDHLPEVFSQGLKRWRFGGGGEVTRFICGYMACEPRLSQVFLSGLPRLVKVSIRNEPSGRWLENSIRFLVDQAGAASAGGEAVLARLSEVLFIETLRTYVTHLPPAQIGWLAGARDPEIGKALALMHRDSARPWTVATLAKEVGISRSVLAERFRHYLDLAPMSYLTRWRIQLGAQRLRTTSYSVAQIADEVGYESEAAFNRAFKREFGIPPARFRAQLRTGGARPANSVAQAANVAALAT